MSSVLFLSVLVAILHAASSWDPDAGMILSYTKSSHVTVTATSGGSSSNKVIDGNDGTNWVSGSCLPSYYFNRQDVNVLHGACADGKCSSTSSLQSELAKATDGSVYTTAPIHKDSTSAIFTVTLSHPESLKVVSLSGIYHGDTTLYAYEESVSGRRLLRVFNSSENYKNINILDLNFAVSKLELESDATFSIKELAAIGQNGCTENVTVDLGTIRSVGTIRTRHWAGRNSASSLELLLSQDGHSWTRVATLDPNALHAVTTNIPEQQGRYIALKYDVNLVNYKKVYCYEIDAWDENGIWGPKFTATPQHKNFRELLGVNGIWGWGTNSYSDTLGDNKGPKLYSAIASHARNYHNLKWDVTDPDLDPEYAEMAANRGTQALWWLNWDREYKTWKDANMSTDIAIQFTNKTVPQSEWNTPEPSAYHYGQQFAKHFGTVQGNGLVDAVEIGNEPWDYDASFYATILKGMSNGIRSIDNKLTVVAGTFQAQDKLEANTYIGTRVLEEVAPNIDVINCHTYSFVNDASGVRRGTYPENKNSFFNNIRPLMRWRDANMPTKPIWVTEWGWDADGMNENCAATECVSEKAQAVYAVRGIMIFARSNIERATWFFYANTDCETLFCRSGLTTSFLTNFQKKTVFRIFEDMLNNIGDAYFLGVIQENDDGYVYALSNTQGQIIADPANKTEIMSKTTHIIAWLPVDIDDASLRHATVDLPHDVHVTTGLRFTGDTSGSPTRAISDFSQSGTVLTLPLSTEPCLVRLVHGHNGPIVG